MAYDVIHKNSTVAGTPPTASEIELGEIAINAADAELYTKDTGGNVQTFISQFTQADSNAVTRTVKSKLKDIVSVKDFGAVGNGVADDTTAFVNALASGLPLLIPQGHYILSSWTVFSGSSDVFMYGAGKPHIEGPGYTGAGSQAFAASTGNVHIEGIKFSQFSSVCASLPSVLNDYFEFVDNETTNTVFSINLNVTAIGGGYKRIYVKGNKISNTTYGAWITPREMHDTIVVDNVFSDLSNSFEGGSATQAVMIGLDTSPGTRLNAVVSNNSFKDIINSGAGETTAIMMHDVRRCTVNGNVIDTVTGGAGEGIYLRREDMDATCTGNTLVDCEVNSIAAKGGKTVIANNRISGRDLQPLFGIGQVEQMEHLIESNWVSNCYCGIYNLSPSGSSLLQSRVEISNNLVTDCVRVGIYASGRSRSMVVTGNKVKNITGGAFRENGRLPDDINAGIDSSFTTGGGSRCVFTNNHISQVLGSTLGSGDGRDSVAMRLKSQSGVIFAELNSYDTVEYGFWVENTVLLQNNYLEYASSGIYHPSSTATASSTLQTYKSAGLAFPSDNSALVSDPTTLDSYIEGTWTPSLGRTATFGTYTPGANDGGKYTRIGNVIYFSCRVEGTNTTAAGGSWVIRGLPFTSANSVSWGRTIVSATDETTGTAFALPRIIENSKDVLLGTAISGNIIYCAGFYFVS